MWHCTDHRLTFIDGSSISHYEDTSVKSIALKCPDGTALISYTGVGALQQGDVHVSDWLRTLLRGESRSLDETLIFIREAASAVLGRPAARAGIPHHFVVGAYLAGNPWIAEISNVSPGSGINSRFETRAQRLDGPAVLAAGARAAIEPSDFRLLQRVAQARPRRKEDYHRVLADVNARAAAAPHPDSAVISPGCLTHSIHRNDPTVHTQFHGDDAGDESIKVAPLLLFGIDTTEMMRVMSEHMAAVRRGDDVDDDAFSRLTEQAARRSVEPLRGALRPTVPAPPQALVPTGG
jgi:hypothetical protein